jgi:predicted ABC-type ATPase
MSAANPKVVIIAGPNGAGKTTTAPRLLADTLGVLEFVNADAIAQGLSAFKPEEAAIPAGRIMLRRLHELANQRRSFAFETTLASKTFAPWIGDLQKTGYAFGLSFLWLPSADLAVARVQERVRLGGHDIPSSTIRRRYRAGLQNFFSIYRPMADRWEFFDNFSAWEPQLIAHGVGTAQPTVVVPERWDAVLRELGHE